MTQVERTPKSSSITRRLLFLSYPPTYADELVRSRILLPIHTAESDIFFTDDTSLISLSSLFPKTTTELSSSKVKAWGHPSSRELHRKRGGTTSKRHQRKVLWQYNLQMTKEE